MNAVNDTLLILGASVRAAAQAARRAGYSPWAADLFGDEDLCACCPALRVEDYPGGLLDAARHGPPGDWMYTGALENYPELIARIAAERTLLGNPLDVIRRARDPLLVATVLREAGLQSPACALTVGGVPRDGSWLRKRVQSAGGVHVDIWDETCKPTSRDVYFQQRIEGVPCSAVFVAARGRAVLLGVTRQLIGRDFGAAEEFQYAGSIGPEFCRPDLLAQWQAIGAALCEAFSLVGLFGVDAIRSEHDSRPSIWPIEVNPRYTASIEVLERARSFQSIAIHVAACREGKLPVSDLPSRLSPAIVGKQIIFAERDLRVPNTFARWEEARNERAGWHTVADIPATGTIIRCGAPIATVFAAGDALVNVQSRLARLAEQLRETLAAT